MLGAVGTAVKAIASRVARAGIEGLYGAAGTTGGGGDAQKKLDVVAVRGGGVRGEGGGQGGCDYGVFRAGATSAGRGCGRGARG